MLGWRGMPERSAGSPLSSNSFTSQKILIGIKMGKYEAKNKDKM